MATLAFVLKALNATIQFLAGAVVLSYQGKQYTLDDDKYFSKWQAVEEHFCRAHEQLEKAPWCDYLSTKTIQEAAEQPDAEPYIFDALEAVDKLVAEAAEETMRHYNKPQQNIDIGDFIEKGENPEILVGYDNLVFPNANVAKRYFFAFIGNLPENADWKDGEATIALSPNPSAGILDMINHIENIIEEHSWTLAKEALEPVASPGPSRPHPVPFVGQVSDQLQPIQEGCSGPTILERGAAGGVYTMADAKRDLLERWDEDINTKEYKNFLRSGLVAGDHMGKQLSSSIWKAASEEAPVEQFLTEIAASIESNKSKFKTDSEARLGLLGAVTMVLARKAQLDLSGGVLTKK